MLQNPQDPAVLAMLPFLYRRVRLTGPGVDVTGRLAAVSPGLITLATGPQQVMLIKTADVQAMAVLAELPTPAQ